MAKVLVTGGGGVYRVELDIYLLLIVLCFYTVIFKLTD